MKLIMTIIFICYSLSSDAWYLTHPETNKKMYCPTKFIPIISEFEKHFTIPLGGKTGSEYIFDTITTDFVTPGKYNGGKNKYYMHCAKFIKSDCHSCNAKKAIDANYCVHYIHPTKGKRQGCLARGIIPKY